MARKRLGVNDAKRLLRQAVENKGADHVVDRCVYFSGGRLNKPACLVGHVIHAFGDDELIRKVSLNEGGQLLTLHGVPLFPELYDYVTPKAAELLYAAQKVQDNLKPWGEAVKEALRQ